MSLILLVAICYFLLLLGGGVLWVRGLAAHLAAPDQLAAAPAVAVVAFGAITASALLVPWDFSTQAALGLAVWCAGGLYLGWRRRAGLGTDLRRCWFLVVPVACAYLSIAAFGAVQGDPAHTLAYPGTILSGRVTNLPPDHLFPVGAVQVLQHRGDYARQDLFEFWDLADRTPLAAASAASFLAGTGTTLPEQPLQRESPRSLAPNVNDKFGYWQVHLLLVLFNVVVILAIGRLAWSIFGMRAAAIAGLLAAINPYLLTHGFFTWPKLLAAYFVLLHYLLVRERRMPIAAGILAGLAYLAHPLAGLFVVPSLIVLIARDLRRAAPTLGALLATIAPWQIWTTVSAHPSRMLTYPLGYTMRHPDQLSQELSVAWDRFRALGLRHAIDVRLENVKLSLWPFDVASNFLTLPAGCDCITRAEAWFTAHDRTLPGIVLFVLLPVAIVGFVAWWRVARLELVWMLVAPIILVMLFWGLDPQGLGASALQPAAVVLITIIAGGLAELRPRIAVAAAVLAVAEAASVVWWSLFTPLDGASTPAIVLAALLWLLPGVLLMVVTAGVNESMPRSRPAIDAHDR